MSWLFRSELLRETNVRYGGQADRRTSWIFVKPAAALGVVRSSFELLE